MTEVTKNITVDLMRRGSTRLIFSRQMDNGSRLIRVRLTKDGEPYIVDKNIQASLNVKRSDGQSSAFVAAVTDDGCVEVMLTLWILAVPGETKCAISLFDSEKNRLTSADFILDVIEALYGDTEVRQDESYTLLTSLMAEVVDFKISEQEREQNEALRIASEQTREASETERRNAENERIEAEELRANSETLRLDAETERANAESVRKSNESARISSENMRVDAENVRSSDENTRVSRENIRVSNENYRIYGENDRIEQEHSRISAEELRAAAELLRDSAEQERIRAHNDRTSTKGMTLAESSSHYSSDNLDTVLDEIGDRLEDWEGELDRVTSPIYGESGQITVTASNWDADISASFIIDGLGVKDMIAFSPVTRADRDLVAKCDIFVAVTDAASHRVTFTATALPEGSITFNYFISRGA